MHNQYKTNYIHDYLHNFINIVKENNEYVIKQDNKINIERLSTEASINNNNDDNKIKIIDFNDYDDDLYYNCNNLDIIPQNFDAFSEENDNKIFNEYKNNIEEEYKNNIEEE